MQTVIFLTGIVQGRHHSQVRMCPRATGLFSSLLSEAKFGEGLVSPEGCGVPVLAN
jgi:hypothetical protein